MIISYSDFLEDYHKNYKIDSNIIPKYLLKTCRFDFDKIPKPMLDAFSKSLDMCPGYKLVYFTDNDRYNFIKEYYPEYLSDYDSIVPGAYRADVFRLLILYKFGGVYSDSCQLFLTSIDEILGYDQYDLVLVGTYTPGMANAFIASKPSNRIIGMMIRKIMSNVSNRSYGDNLLDITGPIALGKAFNEYFNEPEEKMFIIGKYNMDGYNILSHVFEIEDNDPVDKSYICDENKNKLIKAKFSREYFDIMYSNIPHYKYFYDNKKVYKDI